MIEGVERASNCVVKDWIEDHNGRRCFYPWLTVVYPTLCRAIDAGVEFANHEVDTYGMRRYCYSVFPHDGGWILTPEELPVKIS